MMEIKKLNAKSSQKNGKEILDYILKVNITNKKRKIKPTRINYGKVYKQFANK